MINEFHLVCPNDLKPIQIIHLVSIATFVLIQPPEMCGRYSGIQHLNVMAKTNNGHHQH